jgi:very-short-patch-repair endonuclease
MRREPVSTERTLWRLLRDRRLGDLKFRRQVPLGRYVVDFVCMRYRLIVEADGYWHELKVERDAERDTWLVGQGFRVLRFDNGLIASKSHLVLSAIIEASRPVAERPRDPSSDLLRRPPSPARGEGTC